MAANTAPLYALVPNIGKASIATTNAVTGSSGTSTGSGASLMYKAFTAGANGSFVDRVRFFSVATAPTTGVATVLRVFLSSVASPGATTGGSDTYLIGEVSVPAVASSNSVNATSFYDVPVGYAIPTGWYIHVCQHVAQTTNQNWEAIVIGGDY